MIKCGIFKLRVDPTQDWPSVRHVFDIKQITGDCWPVLKALQFQIFVEISMCIVMVVG